jgi:hypothetical protein
MSKFVKEIKKLSESLSMSRVPMPARKKFIELANTEFAGDYGMTLKYLVNSLEEKSKFEYLLARIEELEDAISIHMESHLGQTSKSKPNFEVKRMVSGRIIKIQQKEEKE